jgi:glycosyltransferase involved in cell wall biosynthesis
MSKSLRTMFIGTHLPRKCGLATFLNDLIASVEGCLGGGAASSVVVMHNPLETHDYPARVRRQVRPEEIEDYLAAAEFINDSGADVISLQHEYGIFNHHKPFVGAGGSYIVSLLERLRIPVVTTLHTVLRDPVKETGSQACRDVLIDIARLSTQVVVLSHRAVKYLVEVYGVPESKIALIPHGVPDYPLTNPAECKGAVGLSGRQVISTFGLLSPWKGLDYMVEALAAVVEEHPSAVYVILGATHPEWKRAKGEDYRDELVQRISELGLQDNVIFIDRFLEIEELMTYLRASDIYITPYLGEEQIVSGTLAFAMATGNAVISTPYFYAQEMLADGRGTLVPFHDSAALAQAVTHLLTDDARRHALQRRAHAHTRSMCWQRVGKQYVDVFTRATSPGAR